MIDHARPYDQTMYDTSLYLSPPPTAPERLQNFQVFRKATNTTSFIYSNYYTNPTYDPYLEPEINAEHVYHNLVSRECTREDWPFRYGKMVIDWDADDTVAWVIETAQCLGFNDYEIPYYNFRVTGNELKAMTREEIVKRFIQTNMDHELSVRLGDAVFDKLHERLHEETLGMPTARQTSVFRYAESDPYSQEAVQSVLDLDSVDHKNRLYQTDYKPNDSRILAPACDSSDDTEDVFRSSETASPEYSYGSDGSKSGDEENKRKIFKRPPGRPKGSGRKISKRPRSVSVPEFLRNLLLDPDYCPAIIKWEDHSQGKFRFVKPDEVAKLWGKLKQNDNMTFEKFSRAMRYHYRQSVLVSVPTARLVYQFGSKGPDFSTDNPNFIKIKPEFKETLYC